MSLAQSGGMLDLFVSQRGERTIPLLFEVAFAAVLAGVLCMVLVVERYVADIARALTRPRLIAATAALVAVAIALLISNEVLQQFPSSGDEFAYLFQADTYAHGRTTNAPPPIANIFTPHHVLETSELWAGKYPPGWPFALMVFSLLSIPAWAANAVLTGFLTWSIFVLGRDLEDRRTGAVAAVLFAASAFTLFNGGSYFAHMMTALASVWFAYFANRFLHTEKLHLAIGAGVLLGVVGLTRTHVAIALIPPFAIALVATAPWRIALRGFAGAALGGVPFLVALLAYNYSITGSALLPPLLLYSPTDTFGEFPQDAVPLAIFHLGSRFIELAEWTSAPLLAFYVAALIALGAKSKLVASDFALPALIILLLFYDGTGGNRYGPRYLFDVWPLAVLTSARALSALLRSPDTARPLLKSLAAWSLLFCLLGSATSVARLPALASAFNQIARERLDLDNQITQKALEDAIVLVRSGVGETRNTPMRDLFRNMPDLNQPVLYVDGLAADAEELMRRFPDRSLWTYDRAPGHLHGVLQPLQPGEQ